MIPLLLFGIVDYLLPRHLSTTALIRRLARNRHGRVILGAALVASIAHLLDESFG